jgi:hypothetical protein
LPASNLRASRLLPTYSHRSIDVKRKIRTAAEDTLIHL